jgi:3-dehydroquinate dehydratase-2
MTQVMVIHGPNLHLLGIREPEIYGIHTLADINTRMMEHAASYHMTLHVKQSNSEGALIDYITTHYQTVDFLIINAAALTHTSIALYDTLRAVSIPFIEVHMTQLASREPYRQHSYLAPIAMGSISGFGADSYLLALDALQYHLTQQTRLEETL